MTGAEADTIINAAIDASVDHLAKAERGNALALAQNDPVQAQVATTRAMMAIANMLIAFAKVEG